MQSVESVVQTEAVLAAYKQEIETLRDLLFAQQIEKCRLAAQVDALKARLVEWEKHGPQADA